jgi:hypothetical protein
MMFRTIQSLVVATLLLCLAAQASDIRRVVTGLDTDNKAVVLFDSRMPLQAGPLGLQATNLWVTNSYPLGFSFKEDTSSIPVGVSPLDNGTKFRVVEFPPLDPATESKMEPGGLMKAVGPVAPARGRPVTHPLMHRTRSATRWCCRGRSIWCSMTPSFISSPAIRSSSRPPITPGSITELRLAGSFSC